jgi:hypothetical protein
MAAEEENPFVQEEKDEQSRTATKEGKDFG